MPSNAMPRTPEAKIARYSGVPTLFIDGSPVSGLSFQTYFPTPKHFKSFADAGVKWITFGFFMYDYWPRPGTYSFAKQDEAIRMILEADPDAYVFPRFYLWPPKWWSQQHPRELRRDIEGNEVGSGPHNAERWGDAAGPALASETWRRDTADYLRAAVRHVEQSDYAHRFIGYQLTGEETSEWFYRGYFGGKIDYSLPNLHAFRAWLERRYGTVEALRDAWADRKVGFDTAQLPTPRRREQADIHSFYDPATNRRTIDFYLYHNWIMADTIRASPAR